MTTISIEICYSTGDKDKFEKAQKNAAEFVAFKLKEYGWEIDKIYPHKHWSGKNCPHRTLEEYGWEYFIDLVKGFLMPTSIKEEKKLPFEIGTAVKIEEGAIWETGKVIPSWVVKSKMYICKYKTDSIVAISTKENGEITGTINVKYLMKYETAMENKSKFQPYIVRITANSLNVRAGAGTKYKVNTIVKKNELYTIVDEKDGWGKLKSGAGWISLNYATKVK